MVEGGVSGGGDGEGGEEGCKSAFVSLIFCDSRTKRHCKVRGDKVR